jgi:DNA gyrase/topoisomerase IV subunit B
MYMYICNQVCRDGKVYSMTFARGVAQGPLTERPQTQQTPTQQVPTQQTPTQHQQAGRVDEQGGQEGRQASRGTRIRFKPDPTIFKTTTRFDLDKVGCF